MTDFRNPIAEKDYPDSGQIVKPGDAYVIKEYTKFYCPDHDCLDNQRRLIAKRSKNNNYFFSHLAGYEHDIRPETLLHKSAIKWFINKEAYELPERVINDKLLVKQTVKLNTSKTECEFRRLQTIVPDVSLVTDKGFEFAVEVVVTNDIGANKAKLIEEFQLPTIRVNLTEFYEQFPELCRTDYEFVNSRLEELMIKIELKSWVIPPKYEMSKDQLTFTIANSNYGCFVLLVVPAILLILNLLIA